MSKNVVTLKYRQSDKTATNIYTEDKNTWTKAYTTDSHARTHKTSYVRYQ